MLFQFRLAKHHIPYSSTRRFDYASNWYEMSYGEIYIDLSHCQLLEYSSESKQYFQSAERYCTYYISRFINDLCDMMPVVAIDLPESLKPHVIDINAFLKLRKAIIHHFKISPDELPDENMSNWISDRAMHINYLIGGPTIWFFKTGDQINLHWKSDYTLDNNIPLWNITNGQCLVPYEDFKASLHDFGRDFFDEMDKKIQKTPGLDQSDQIQLFAINANQRKRYDEQLDIVDHPRLFDWQKIELNLSKLTGLELL